MDSPLNHARFLHGSGRGCITLRHPSPQGWHHRSDPLEKAEDSIAACGGLEDAYVTLNRFRGSRHSRRLLELSAMSSDLDFYKIVGLEDAQPEGVLQFALEELERAKIPHPSLAVATGRGLTLVWRHTAVPSGALNRWKLCQDHIFQSLKSLGADPSSVKDATRMMRLVGSINPKSGKAVRAIWQERGDATWDFDDLTDEILPYTREEMAERRARLAKNKNTSKTSRSTRRAANDQGDLENRFTPYTLALARLGDLQKLLRLRGIEQLRPGHRDVWMFAAGVSMAYLEKPQSLEEKLIQLGRKHAGWSEAETRSRMGTIIRLAHEAAAGEKVEWKGRKVDPRYRLSNNKIIKDLCITPSEEAEMATIISDDTKRKRDTARKRQKRREEGAKPRDEKTLEVEENKRIAKDLQRHGVSWRDIGKVINKSHTQVGRLLAKDGDT